jgi:hypothetical protein
LKGGTAAASQFFFSGAANECDGTFNAALLLDLAQKPEAAIGRYDFMLDRYIPIAPPILLAQ